MAVNDAPSACHLLDAHPLETQVMLSGAQAPAQLSADTRRGLRGRGAHSALNYPSPPADARLTSAALLRHCALNSSIILYRNST